MLNALLGELRLNSESRKEIDKYADDPDLLLFSGEDKQKIEKMSLDTAIPHAYINGSIAYYS